MSEPIVYVDNSQIRDGKLKALKTASVPYDLMLLDLNMPVMDGMKLLGKLREDGTLARTTNM